MRTSILFLLFGVLGFFGTGIVNATDIDEINFPIAQLGSCENEQACFAYCEIPKNFEACYQFGTENGLIEENVNPEMLNAVAGGQGPGGCSSQVECEAYCSDSNHIVECVAFAEKNGLMSEEELAEAKHVASAIEAGASLPGGCTNKDSCEAYCQDASHMEECIAFAEAAGFMSGEELAEAKRMMMLIEEGGTPGGCASQEVCETYCEDESHFEECLNFAVKMGSMTIEEAEKIKTGGKMPQGPGGCKSEEECNAYCEDPAHLEECMQSAVEQGFMSPEKAQELFEQTSQQPEKFNESFTKDFGEEGEEMMKGGIQGKFGDEFGDEFEGEFGNQPSEGFEEIPEDWGNVKPEYREEDLNVVPPEYDVEPERLFETPPLIETVPSEPGALGEQPNATFVESVKTFLSTVLMQ